MTQCVLVTSYSLPSLDAFTLQHPTAPHSGRYQLIHVINKSQQRIKICRSQVSLLSPSTVPVLTATIAVPMGLTPRSTSPPAPVHLTGRGGSGRY